MLRVCLQAAAEQHAPSSGQSPAVRQVPGCPALPSLPNRRARCEVHPATPSLPARQQRTACELPQPSRTWERAVRNASNDLVARLPHNDHRPAQRQGVVRAGQRVQSTWLAHAAAFPLQLLNYSWSRGQGGAANMQLPSCLLSTPRHPVLMHCSYAAPGALTCAAAQTAGGRCIP